MTVCTWALPLIEFLNPFDTDTLLDRINSDRNSEVIKTLSDEIGDRFSPESIKRKS